MGEPTEITTSTPTNSETAVAIRDDILRAYALTTEIDLWFSHLDAILGSLPMVMPGVPVDLAAQTVWLKEMGYLDDIDPEGLIDQRTGARGFEFYAAMLSGQNVANLEDMLEPTTNREKVAAARANAETAFLDKEALFETFIRLYFSYRETKIELPEELVTIADELYADYIEFGYDSSVLSDPHFYLSDEAQFTISDTSVEDMQSAIRTILSKEGLEFASIQRLLPENLLPLANLATWEAAIAIDVDVSASIAFFTDLINTYDPTALKLRLDVLRGHIINLPNEIMGVSIAFIKDALLVFEARTRERVNALKRAGDTLARIRQLTRPYSIQLAETREETLRGIVAKELLEEMRTWPWFRNVLKDEWESLSNDELWDVANWALLNNPHNLEPLNRGFLQVPEFEGYMIPNDATWDRHIALLTALEEARPTPITTNSWAIVIELAFSIFSEVFDYITSFGDVVNSLNQRDWGAAGSTIFFAAIPILPGSFSKKLSEFLDSLPSHSESYRAIIVAADIDEATKARLLAKVDDIDDEIAELREPISALATRLDEFEHIIPPRTRGEYLIRADEILDEYLKLYPELGEKLGLKKKNPAVADYILFGGERGTIESLSGRENWSRAPLAPFVPKNKIDELFSDVKNEGGGAGISDTEVKILFEFARRYPDRTTTGTIFLFTDIAPCPSCSRAIREFEESYGNMRIVIVPGRRPLKGQTHGD